MNFFSVFFFNTYYETNKHFLRLDSSKASAKQTSFYLTKNNYFFFFKTQRPDDIKNTTNLPPTLKLDIVFNGPKMKHITM